MASLTVWKDKSNDKNTSSVLEGDEEYGKEYDSRYEELVVLVMIKGQNKFTFFNFLVLQSNNQILDRIQKEWLTIEGHFFVRLKGKKSNKVNLFESK